MPPTKQAISWTWDADDTLTGLRARLLRRKKQLEQQVDALGVEIETLDIMIEGVDLVKSDIPVAKDPAKPKKKPAPKKAPAPKKPGPKSKPAGNGSNDLQTRIAAVVTAAKEPMTPQMVAKKVRVLDATARRYLTGMVSQGLLKDVGHTKPKSGRAARLYAAK